jgi:hypothetical protein
MEPTEKYETHRKRMLKNVETMWDYLVGRTKNSGQLEVLKEVMLKVYQCKM